jgi:hypothetical protein
MGDPSKRGTFQTVESAGGIDKRGIGPEIVPLQRVKNLDVVQ